MSERFDQHGKQSKPSQHRTGEATTGPWRFLGFDMEYRVIQLHSITQQIRTLNKFTILWNEDNSPTFLPM